MSFVTPEDIADELGRPTPSPDTQQWRQWSSWIDRALRAIVRRAEKVGVSYETLDPEAVSDVIIQAVARRATRPVDGAESTTDQVAVDDGSVNQTRRYGTGLGDIHFLDAWWDDLGLTEITSGEWSGSITYGGR